MQIAFERPLLPAPVAYRWRRKGFGVWTLSENKPEPVDGYEDEALHPTEVVVKLVAERDALQDQVTKAANILTTMKREIPKTMGDTNLNLIMEDILSALEALQAH